MKKIIIFIDGNSNTGKSTLSKFIEKKFYGFKHIKLDEFKKIKFSDMLHKKINEKYYNDFIKNYYDKEKILDAIKNEERIILDGCFCCTLNLKPDILLFTKDSKKSQQQLFEKIASINPKTEEKIIKIFLNHWNNIWKHYLEKFEPHRKADFTF